MAWAILVVAGLFEIGWAIGLKSSEGLSRPVVALATLVALAASIGLLALALRELPLGTGYAVWTGIGALGTAVIGMVWLGESASMLRLAAIALILAGIVLLKVAD